MLKIQLRHCLWKCWYCMKRSQECGRNGRGCTRLAVRFYAYSSSVLREQQLCNLSTSPSLPPSPPLGMLGRTDLISCHETYAVRPPSHSAALHRDLPELFREPSCYLYHAPPVTVRYAFPPFLGPPSGNVPSAPLPFPPSQVAFLVVTLSSILQPSDAGLSIDFASNSLI